MDEIPTGTLNPGWETHLARFAGWIAQVVCYYRPRRTLVLELRHDGLESRFLILHQCRYLRLQDCWEVDALVYDPNFYNERLCDARNEIEVQFCGGFLLAEQAATRWFSSPPPQAVE